MSRYTSWISSASLRGQPSRFAPGGDGACYGLGDGNSPDASATVFPSVTVAAGETYTQKVKKHRPANSGSCEHGAHNHRLVVQVEQDNQLLDFRAERTGILKSKL